MEEWSVRCIPFNRRWLIESSCRTLRYLQTYGFKESDAISLIKAKHLSILLVKLKCSYRMIVVSRMTACFRYMAPLAIKVGLHAFSSYLEWGHRAHKVELPYPYTQGDTLYDSLHQEGTILTENGRPQHSIPYLGTSSMFCQT